MIKKTVFAAAAAGLLLAVGQASADTITFDEIVAGLPVLAEGDTLSTQYAGVTFTANAFIGGGNPTTGKLWATNTDMTITNSVTGDVGGLGSPTGLVSGNVLHAFGNVYDGWFAEDGDASFRVTFDTPISFFSAAFAGVSNSANVRIFAYNGLTPVGLPAAGTTTGQFVLSVSGASITSVVITPGDYNDWVGVDNITYAVPEASTYAMMALGMGLLAFKRRKTA